MKTSFNMYDKANDVPMSFDDNESFELNLCRNGKRKSVEDIVLYSSLEENIKRCKITNTPGELRLQTDLKDISVGLRGVAVEVVNPASLIVTFNDEETLGVSSFGRAPNNFLITVPRYYPHARPTVKCLDMLNTVCESPHSPRADKHFSYINGDGDIVHPALLNEWSALGSLKTILDILHFIRMASVNS